LLLLAFPDIAWRQFPVSRPLRASVEVFRIKVQPADRILPDELPSS